jgi:integrase
MARTIDRLTDMKAKRETEPGLHPDGGGLYLQVKAGTPDPAGNPTLVKSWLFRFKSPTLGKVRDMGLGPYPLLSLQDARRKAEEAARLKLDGIDPIEHRNAKRAAQIAAIASKAKTFDGCCEGYVAAHSAGWGTEHTRVWQNSIRDHVTAAFGKRPVAEVDTALVLKVLEPLWLTKHETARRLRARIESVLDWAKVHKYREGDNPARWKGHLDNLLAKPTEVHSVEHHPALPYRQIGTMMDELRAHDDRDSRCLELLILTVARVDAATRASAEEFDLAARVWTIPPERMKRRGKRKAKPFRVPLSDAAIAVVERTGVKEGALFPQANDKSLAKAHGRDDITSHGFRSTFRDWAGECTNFQREVIEVAMAHALGDDTEEAYARGDLFEKRRKLMDAWAGYCAKPAATGEVVPIRAKA